MDNAAFNLAIQWYLSDSHGEENPEVCQTRDVFQARLDTLYREISVMTSIAEKETALLVAVTGEIGNNCFDHNLGQWEEIPGCWFSWSFNKGITLVISDQGQGILNSLKRVQPNLKTEEEALQIAFEKRVSGRSPEQRGNGLKFVRSVIHQNPHCGFLFFSGNSFVRFGGSVVKKEMEGKINKKQGCGTLAIIDWKSP